MTNSRVSSPRNRRRSNSCKAILAAVATAAASVCAAHAQPAALPDRAAFYSKTLAQAYADVTSVLELAAWCRDHFPEACGRDVNSAAQGLDQGLTELRLVTVFGREPGAVPPMQYSFKSAEEMRPVLAQRGDQFRADERRYDEDLFARYGAVLEVCPGQNPEHATEVLETASAVDLQRFWGLSLPDFKPVAARINVETGRLAGEIKAHWSPERCIATREFGHDLLASLVRKIKPYTRPDWQKYTDRDRAEQGYGYIWGVALQFEATVHPEVMQKVGDIDRKPQ